ncbi:hypothetical protein BCR33DRAFT_716381, partial [Rhizoclosmatium globosum]
MPALPPNLKALPPSKTIAAPAPSSQSTSLNATTSIAPTVTTVDKLPLKPLQTKVHPTVAAATPSPSLNQTTTLTPSSNASNPIDLAIDELGSSHLKHESLVGIVEFVALLHILPILRAWKEKQKRLLKKTDYKSIRDIRRLIR